MSYQDDVTGDARNFLKENEEMVRETITDGNQSIDDARDYSDHFHEQVTDRSYSFQDAVVILAECENEETDSGMWEGKDLEDAVVIKAAYSYSNDVRSQVDDLFKEVLESYEEKLSDLETEYEELEERSDAGEELTTEEQAKLDDKENIVLEQAAFNMAWEEFKAEEEAAIELIAPGSEEEKYAIKKWQELGDKAGMFSGYPLGQAYIDARVGSGHGIPDVKNYVDYDHLLSEQLPHLSGKYDREVKGYYNEQFGREDEIANLVKAMKLIRKSPEAISALADATLRSLDLNEALGIASESLSNYFEQESEINLYDAIDEAAQKWWPKQGDQYGNFNNLNDFADAARSLLNLGDKKYQLSEQATGLIKNATNEDLAPLYEKWKAVTEHSNSDAKTKNEAGNESMKGFQEFMKGKLSPENDGHQEQDHNGDLERD